MQKIVPYLWFNDQAEEAMEFYVSLFPDSKIDNVTRLGEEKILTATFELCGQQFMVLNGGPLFHFTEAVSFFVNCENQEEVDRLWNALTADGGEEQPCGWLKDKYGLSWQIIPTALGQLMSDQDPERANRVMQAMLQMKKIDVPTLQRAYNGE